MSEPTSAPVPYEQPAIVRRDTIKGLLDATAPSDANTPPQTFPPVISDVNVKENILPVRWYEQPAIVRRDSIAALLITPVQSDGKPDA